MELDTPCEGEPLRDIYSLIQSTFEPVGQDYIDCLVRNLAQLTKSKLVLVQQLVMRSDCKGDDSKKLIGSDDPAYASSLDALSPYAQLLLNRGSFTTQPQEAWEQNTATLLSSVKDTPQALTLLHSVHESNIVGPGQLPSGRFVGVRLDKGTGEPLGIMWVVTQQTKHVLALLKATQLRTSRELERIHEEEHLIKARNAATQDAEDKIRFLADMSHEIRTPMNAVIALTDLLLQERVSLNAEQEEHLEVIQTSGHHLLTIINDILDISKINHDPKFKLETRPFRLRKCVKDALNMARHQATMSQPNKVVYVVERRSDFDRGEPLRTTFDKLELPKVCHGKTVLPLAWHIDDDVPIHVMGDTMRLTQILLNLCSNAVKFTKSGGIRVRIKRYVPTPALERTETVQPHKMTFRQRYDAKVEHMYARAMRSRGEPHSSGHDEAMSGTKSNDAGDGSEGGAKAILEISVTDTGIGIPADRLPKLFKSFSQIDISTARRYGGTGLGLAISSTLVNCMGGGLWVESEEGVGSRFALTLPMEIAPSRSDHAAPSGGALQSPPSPSSTVSDGGHSVLSSSGNEGYPVSPQGSYFPPTGLMRSPSPGTPFPIEADAVSSRSQTHASVHTQNKDSVSKSTAAARSQGSGEKGNVSRSQRKLEQTTSDQNLSKSCPAKILLAEDNLVNQRVGVQILKKLGYNDVKVANNGLEALAMMAVEPFDVIFMDLYMPESDGLEATRAIMDERQHGRRGLRNAVDVYIIALTASASSEDRKMCSEAGMNAFISKPFTKTVMKDALIKYAAVQSKRRRVEEADRVCMDDPMTGIMADAEPPHPPRVSSVSTRSRPANSL